MNKSSFVSHDECPDCGSSDAFSWYDDGHGHCYVCNHQIQPKQEARILSPEEPEPRSKKIIPLTPLTDVFRPLVKRGIPEDAVKKYQIDVCVDRDVDVAHRYPYFKNGVHVANQVRRRSAKDFWWEGVPKNVELFGQQLFPAGSAKAVTVVEGALDAPSGWVLLGSRYPVVAVTNASAAGSECQTNYEYLDSFDEIVLCFDNDETKQRKDGTTFHPGQDAAKKVAELFTPGKCRILTLQHGKDPNDYRVKGIEPKVFVSEWWKAPKFTPDGLVFGTDMWDKIINRPQHFQIPYPFEGLNKKTYGIRLSEFVVINAPTGVGKTSLLKEIEYAILTNPEVVQKGYGVGFLHLEELDTDLALGLMSVHHSKPYHLPDTERTEADLHQAYSDVIDTNRVVIYDHFGSNEIGSILAKVRHMAALGCRYVVIDHLSIIVSDQTGDERKQLDEISTKLKTLCMEQNIALICVIHQNRQGLIRGTAGVEQLANVVLRLERDLLSPDNWRRNITKVLVDKNRFSGRTGPAEHLFYEENTGRMVPLDELGIQKYEEGGSINDSDISF